MNLTVFYRHPDLGSGSNHRTSAEIAGQVATDMIPEDLAEEEEPQAGAAASPAWDFK